MAFMDWLLSFRKIALGPQVFIGSAFSGYTGKVAAEESKTLASVYAAIHAYSDAISTAEVGVYDSAGEPQTSNPLWKIFTVEMNTEQTPQQGLSYLVESLFGRGDAYGQILRNPIGQVVGVVPLEPSTVTPKRKDKQIVYHITGETEPLPARDMIHVPINYDPQSLHGVSSVAYARRVINLGLALDNYGLSFFANGGSGRPVLQVPGQLTTAQAEELAKRWGEQYGGIEGANKIAVVSGGITVTRTTLNPDDSQFLESRKFTVNEIARCFNLPPSRIGGDRASGTYANLEQDQLAFVIHSLKPVCRMFEQEFNRKLLTPAERGKVAIKFKLDELIANLGGSPNAPEAELVATDKKGKK